MDKKILLINLPWLVLTQVIFRIQLFLSNEDFCNKIGDTHFFISRRPTKKDDTSKFDLIIDLTSEFSCAVTREKCIFYPNLDGNKLAHLPHVTGLNEHQNILIHCANGHGRASLFCSIIMTQLGIVKNYQEGLSLIKKSRPLAFPNKEQCNWLNTLEK